MPVINICILSTHHIVTIYYSSVPEFAVLIIYGIHENGYGKILKNRLVQVLF